MEDESRVACETSADRTLLRVMLEHSNDGICLVSRDGTVLATTPAIERMIGRGLPDAAAAIGEDFIFDTGMDEGEGGGGEERVNAKGNEHAPTQTATGDEKRERAKRDNDEIGIALKQAKMAGVKAKTNL